MSYSYSVQLDVDDDRAYTSGLCELANVTGLDWSAGMAQPYSQISNPSILRVTLANEDGRYDLEDENGDYFGLIHPGR